ncbi:MAG: hypothetical protein WCE79_13045 [Xanthobacteraceae bacterium]
MATAADRILANLPPTFAPLPRPTAISALADAFGGELSQAERVLAAVMFAHWVDFADKDSDLPIDLTSIAALYGLAPRDDETIEEFRAHLKRYIRTFIEGTVTVRGVCRIVAEALGLIIADDYSQLDTWWNRSRHAALTTIDHAGDDAATLLFGVPAVALRGAAARAAELIGTVDLSTPVDLRGHSRLRFAVNGGAPATFDLAPLLGDPAAATLDEIVAALASADGAVALAQHGRLVLRSATAGPPSTIELHDLPDDAVPALLGIAPHLYTGTAAVTARIVGAVELPATLDLTAQRFLRLTIDGKSSYEIDCAGGNAAATTPAQIVAAITVEAGAGIATLEGNRLALASPTPGLAGTIALSAPTAGDATQLLLGAVPLYVRGSDEARARVSGGVDLSAGIDLSERANLSLSIDAAPPIIVNCAGADPAKTLAGDIASAINAAVGSTVASQNGKTVTLTSKLTGPAGSVRFLTAPAGDALDLIFGLAPRTASGTDARPATFTGDRGSDAHPDLDLRAQHRVQIAVDDGAPVIVDFAAAGLSRKNVTPAEVAQAINSAVGQAVAAAAGKNLVLASSTPGEQGSLSIVPIESTQSRPFVSRAFPIDEASNAALGFFAAEAQGTDATTGWLAGALDLHDGLDLRTKRFLRLAVDGSPPRDVDCATGSTRPYAVLLADIVAAINKRFKGSKLASIKDDRLVLTSTTAGATSKVVLLPNAGDASREIFGFDPKAVAGTEARRPIFSGLSDLSSGVDLSTADRVKLAIDGGTAVEIACAGANPAATVAAEIAVRINTTLGGSYASTDGRSLRLSSALAGNAGSIAFLAPSQKDATRAIFGVSAGRTYHGDEATSAVLVGARSFAAPLDLSATPFVRLAVDAGAPMLIDCRGADPANTTAAEIATRIGTALAPAATAAVQGNRIAVVANSKGAASRIALQAAGDGDARELLLGDAKANPGVDAGPATVRGSIDLRQPIDLSRRSTLRLALDGGRAADIDLSGAAPNQTFGDEIVAAINKELAGVASLDDKGFLVLASPSIGEHSSVAVEPLRPIEVIEYPGTATQSESVTVKNGGRFELDNNGVAEATVAFSISGTSDVGGISLIALSTGQRIHVDAIGGKDESISIAATPDGRVEAAIVDASGARTPVASDHVSATPATLVAVVPFDGLRPLATGETGARPALTLIDPLANNTVVLTQTTGSDSPLAVAAVAADSAAASPPPNQVPGTITLIGRISAKDRTGELKDGSGTPIARVRGAASLAPFDGQMVVAGGTWYPAGAGSLLAIETIARVFDVKMGSVAFAAVAIDARAGDRSLSARIAALQKTPIAARDARPADTLLLSRGKSSWMLLQCDSARFDAANYDSAHFAGGVCSVPGVFNVSRFNAKGDDVSSQPITGELARFNPLGTDQSLTVNATWQSNQAGAFQVNLPADLPDSFGARFNAGRFASKDDNTESYPGVVFDPPSDPHFVVSVLSEAAKAVDKKPLISVEHVTSIPIGWEAQIVPFAQPRRRYLRGGRKDRPSQLYLQQRGVAGAFRIFARENGAWGNQISITVRFAAPAIFDLTVSHAAARFESARVIAFAGRVLKSGEDPLPALTADAVKPGPVGVVQAKAAGIHATVNRERA